MATTSAADHDEATDPEPGRLFLLRGERAPEVARAVAARLPRAVVVDGAVVAAMIVSGVVPAPTAPLALANLEQLFLRYTAGLAVAETFRLAGYDAVVAEDLPGDRLEDYLDFAAPSPVHLVTLGEDETPWGLRVPDPGAGDDALSEEILRRADEARVETDPGEAEPS